MMFSKHLDKNNLHHAYLIEGLQNEVNFEILKFIQSLGIKTKGNPDFIEIKTDTFKIEDARNLKSFAVEKGMSNQDTDKKIFIISANNFLLEAQNTLLKLFEEPIENTYFFVITPDASIFLKTLLSRFYFISTRQDLVPELKEVEKFIKMTSKDRLEFIKELLTEEEVEDEDNISLNSSRTKSLKFLNALELSLHKRMSKSLFDMSAFDHIFKVRQFLRQPGSSAKTLMESVALITPNFSK